MQLSERLAAIASLIGQNETVGDIGADHAYIPIFLWRSHITKQIIVSDLNEGPLRKAAENIHKELGYNPFELRQSDGLQNFLPGEIHTAVIAGMGGHLIRSILAAYPQTTRSVKKFIMQPRNAQAGLRRWLAASGFVIYDEMLAQEGRFICEIIAARPGEACLQASPGGEECFGAGSGGLGNLDYEISPLLIQKKDPLLAAFIQKKIDTETKIAQAAGPDHPVQYEASVRRIQSLRGILNRL